jgi:ELWxxDGT repeat protein
VTSSFFVEYDDAHGSELWVSDGSPASTRLVRDILPGPSSSFTYSTPAPVAIGSDLFFAVDEGQKARPLAKRRHRRRNAAGSAESF